MKKSAKNSGERKPKTYDLQRGLREWQATLRLLDWEIEAAWVPNFRDRGHNAVTAELKRSTISINAELRVQPLEAEVTLVHELLHVHFDFADFNYRRLKGVMLEQTIEILAQTLMNLKYGG